MAKIIPVDPFDYVVFGALGDLSKRKLFPALFHRELDGQLPTDARIFGSGRKDVSTSEFRDTIAAALVDFVGADLATGEKLEAFLARLEYIQIDVTTEAGYGRLAEVLEHEDTNRPQVFYLALAPQLYADVAKFLAGAGLNGENKRLVLEKPLGHDLPSSKAINSSVGAHFAERQIYRIDHYLGKESVQNLIALRFGNMIFESLWNAKYIDHVQITAAETVGLGSRAAYYNDAGAMRDMVQNHLLQLMCLTAMEPPADYEADSIRDEKLKVLRALRPINAANAAEKTLRGQYASGQISGKTVPAYVDELGAPSDTETFVALCAEVENWRWSGVPFFLRTGKCMPARYSEIVVQFKNVPHSIFPDHSGEELGNRLVIRLQPDEGVRLDLMTKDPGPGGMRLRGASLDLSFAEEYEDYRFPDAYERLLLDVVRGNSTLFMRNDEVEAAWAWVDPILAAWADGGQPSELYKAGTQGPASAEKLIGEGRAWQQSKKEVT